MLGNLLLWSVLGVLSGALIQIFFPADKKHLFGTISAGIFGAFVGGIIYSTISIGSVAIILDPIASFVALIGAITLVYFIRFLIKNDREIPDTKEV